jgi:hypothetical protein
MVCDKRDFYVNGSSTHCWRLLSQCTWFHLHLHARTAMDDEPKLKFWDYENHHTANGLVSSFKTSSFQMSGCLIQAYSCSTFVLNPFHLTRFAARTAGSTRRTARKETRSSDTSATRKPRTRINSRLNILVLSRSISPRERNTPQRTLWDPFASTW